MSPVTHADIKMYMNAHVGCGTDILVTQMMISTKWKPFPFTKHTKHTSPVFLHLSTDNEMNESDWTNIHNDMNMNSAAKNL